MKRILIVGSGDVARRAIPWLVKRFRVFALVRQSGDRAELRALGATPVLADLDDRRSLRRLAGIADAVMHFAPPPDHGTRDMRSARLAAALARASTLPQRLVYISTTGVYGDCAGRHIDESHPCRPQTARAQRRVDAERCLRRFGARSGVRVSVLRAPGIYAGDRLPLARLERGEPVLRAEEDVHTNHIHAEDLARLACLALFRAGAGRVYNAVDDTCMKMGDYFDFAADCFGLPRPPRLSRSELAGRLSPMALSFMSESRQLDNRRIRRELRARLRYPTVREGFAAALDQKPTT
ncbi:NAD(P)H-binding protein [Aromatoleum toluvorans]|uniref:NAD(P)H-binding protein n=1 Tax=Aromatoleum toluvorans TaxID=92002 RepID=A0ABX1Q5W7_9RHOO|nr:NAD(P)H-binding protein [Aromatoleum toluvorans]NMG45756.1 NAD(P)H-binding protein [Aromatoleum toluvorans]